MSLLSIGFFVVVLIVLASMFHRGADPFSPARIFLIVWCSVIGLAELKLSLFQSTWSWYSWIVIIIGPLGFLLGVTMVAVKYLDQTLIPLSSMRDKIRYRSMNITYHYRLTIGLFLIYLAAYFVEAWIEGGLPMFSTRPDRARVEFGVFGIHLIVNTMPLLLFLLVESWLFSIPKTSRRVIILLAGTLTAVSYFLILQRFDFVVAVLWIIPFLHYLTEYLKPWKLAVAAIGCVIFLFGVSSIRIVAYVQDYLYLTSRMKLPYSLSFLTEPYMYVVMNVENFARGVENLQSFTYGYFTGDFLLALVGLKHWLGDYFSIIDRPFLNSGYNTFPLFWTYYYDFGIVGVGIGSLILGLVIGIIYYRMRTIPTIVNIGLYSFSFFIIVISFFTNPLTMLKINFNIALWLLIHFLVKRRLTGVQ